MLIAAVDAAHLVCTKTEEGRIMNQLVMSVRNTQKQYMRIDIPRTCDIWSTIVSGQPVKPARDKETGSVMVPLQKSSGSGSSGPKHAAFKVEIVWVQSTNHDQGAPDLVMRERGALRFQFPKVDIPLNVVLVSLYVPEDFKYTDILGDLRTTEHFSHAVPTPTTEASPVPQPMPMMSQSNAIYRHGSMSSINLSSRDEDEDEKVLSSAYEISYAPAKGKKAGVVPVRVNMITSGRMFRFERLLVTNQTLNIQVSYRKTAPSWKRRTGPSLPCC